ncbi:MAG: hypothetical protein II993_01690, partial [Anaerotignum sp.]|nr:hypothetical protein [Anaerotignum sp.]
LDPEYQSMSTEGYFSSISELKYIGYDGIGRATQNIRYDTASRLNISARQADILLAGDLLNYTKDAK